MSASRLRPVIVLAAGLFFRAMTSAAYPQDMPQESIRTETDLPLREVGQGTYHRFGFSVYQATLWALDDRWNPQKPFLLELHYVRDISKDVLVESIMDDIRDQNTADETDLGRWEHTLAMILPDVQDGDILSGLSVPGAKTKLFRNGKEIATLDDDSLSRAFFNMWFGDHADPDLRRELLGHS